LQASSDMQILMKFSQIKNVTKILSKTALKFRSLLCYFSGTSIGLHVHYIWIFLYAGVPQSPLYPCTVPVGPIFTELICHR